MAVFCTIVLFMLSSIPNFALFAASMYIRGFAETSNAALGGLVFFHALVGVSTYAMFRKQSGQFQGDVESGSSAPCVSCSQPTLKLDESTITPQSSVYLPATRLDVANVSL